MTNCTFCSIISGKEHAFVVFENESSLAFLDKRPLFAGHTLLIPKDHIATLPELPIEKVCPFFQTVRMLTIAVEQAMEAHGSFVALNNRVSQSVPHLHVHIVPRSKGDGLKGFFWPRKKYRDEEEMSEVRDRIKTTITKQQLAF